MRTYKYIFLMLLGSILYLSCNDNEEINTVNEGNKKATTRALVTEEFDWDTAEEMPSPSSQQIPMPWIGQGSLSAVYDLDVVNDHYKKDGWEMVYSTFKSSGPELQNPYFVLYNKYRGLLRLYFYVTNQTVLYSTNISSSIQIIGSYDSSLLNFTGSEIVNGLTRNKQFSQVSQASSSGGSTYAPNRWYMFQYELAYDPTISSGTYNTAQFMFNMAFVNSQNVTMNGKQTGTIKGTIGENSNNLVSKLTSIGTSAVDYAFGFIGKSALLNYTLDETSGDNSLGIKSSIWKDMLSGASSMVSGGTTSTLKSFANLFNAIVFGGSNNVQTVTLNFESSISLNGTITETGSFPGTPISHYIPGTYIPSTVTHYIPLYNKPLGVFNLLSVPTIKMRRVNETYSYWDDSLNTPIYVTETLSSVFVADQTDFSKLLEINPEVLNYATIEVDYDIIGKNTNTGGYAINPYYSEISSPNPHYSSQPMPDFEMFIRYRVKVTPKDSNIQPSLLVKTFKADYSIETVNKYYSTQKGRTHLIDLVNNEK